ncbi:MAG: hypothetical protein ABR866_21420, partial [Candidatus Korobacteraceae bacterium]
MELADKLRQEWPGILQWAIDGCLSWQREGLQPSTIVKDTTNDYLVAEDRLGLWLEERCEVKDSNSATAADLFASWCDWCARNGEYAGSQKGFSQALEAHGFVRTRSTRAVPMKLYTVSAVFEPSCGVVRGDSCEGQSSSLFEGFQQT